MKQFLPIATLLFFSVLQSSVVLAHHPKLTVTRKSEEPAVGNIIRSTVWDNVPVRQTFHAPWSKLRDDTRFQCYMTDNYFYFKFSVTDSTLALRRPFKKKLDVAEEDRVEIFLSPTANMKTYYCMEMDPDGYTLDYKANYFRKFNYTWNFSTLELETAKDNCGYTVAGRLSVVEMKRLGMPSDGFYIGVFRADFDAHGNVVWYSLSSRYRSKADFHVPEMQFKAAVH